MDLAIYYDRHHSEHDPGPGHPETPARIEACIETISGRSDLVSAPEPAAREDLARVHDPAYLEHLERVCQTGGGWIDADTFAGPSSHLVAARAAGAVCDAVDEALENGRRSFCLVRPPGHHATSNQAMGFCLLNNVAVGAARAMAAGAGKVMILDFDVHHGNGTQEIFWNEPRVLYVSTHQWPWYPWRAGALEEVGGPQAVGTNVNVPLPAGAGDEELLAAMSAIAVPLGRDFGPDLLLLSAGFDAHVRDPLSQLMVTRAGFEAVVAAAVALADEMCEGRVVAALEGGYDLEGLSESFASCIAALKGPGRTPPASTPIPALVASAASFHQQIRANRSR